jgi:hypothetical protein
MSINKKYECKMKMELKTSVDESFLEHFYKEEKINIENTSSEINLFILKIENNEFCYPELINELTNRFITFSLSRVEYQNFVTKKRFGELYNKAASKFRNYTENDGEAGELLLYCFLESHLKAPKILTKLEIKLSSNKYANGSDGIHLLKLGENNYQLIFGESKLNEQLTDSISNAFKSIHDFKNRDKDNINDEIGLINSQLCKEAYDEKLYQFLKEIIMPKVNVENPISKNNAFAIFAGFEITPSDAEKKMPNDVFLKTIREKISKEVMAKKEHIKNKIDEYKLNGYAFYVYVFPFTKLKDIRKDIIKKITLAEAEGK